MENNIDSSSNVISFGYGKAGRISDPVLVIGNLIRNKDYNSIRTLINSDNPAIKYLAILTCLTLDKKGIIELDKIELGIIELIKNSQSVVKYWSGCTIKDTFTIQQLFQEEKNTVNKSINNWLKRQIK